jgi:PPP family 3-phenylpropionic acid transporter
MSSGRATSSDRVASGKPAPAAIPWVALGSAMATVGVVLGIYNPFIAVTLASKGFDVAAVGIITGLAAIGYMVAVPIWGQLADTRLGRPQALATTAIAGGLLLASIQLLAPPPLVAPLFLGGSLFVAAWLSLTDAIVVNAVHDSRRYARLRLISSLTYALGALAAGLVYRSTGFGLSLVLVGVGGVILGLTALRLPDVARAAEPAGHGDGRRWWSPVAAPFALLRRTPGLPLALFAIALGFLGYIAGNTYLGLYLLELGGDPGDIGLASAISATIEIPAIFLAGLVAQRYGVRTLFVIAAASAAIGCVGWAVAPGVPFVLASRVFAGVGYGGMLVAGVMSVRFFLPPERQGTGQGLFQATCFGLAALVVNVLGGQLHGVIGYRGLFAVCAAVGVIGILVGWRVLPRTVGSLPLDAVPLEAESAA